MKSVRPGREGVRVFDLTVDEAEEFVVGGILVHNSKVFHVPGLNALEDELTSWIPFEGPSPNRLDAMVYGISNVAANIQPASIGSPLRLVV